VDEAAQALEAECLIPLSLAGSHTKIILSGDHMQVRDFHKCTRLGVPQLDAFPYTKCPFTAFR
jgi:predicted ribonuclease YlaK